VNFLLGNANWLVICCSSGGVQNQPGYDLSPATNTTSDDCLDGARMQASPRHGNRTLQVCCLGLWLGNGGKERAAVGDTVTVLAGNDFVPDNDPVVDPVGLLDAVIDTVPDFVIDTEFEPVIDPVLVVLSVVDTVPEIELEIKIDSELVGAMLLLAVPDDVTLKLADMLAPSAPFVIIVIIIIVIIIIIITILLLLPLVVVIFFFRFQLMSSSSLLFFFFFFLSALVVVALLLFVVVLIF
jgi:hypothetical protein